MLPKQYRLNRDVEIATVLRRGKRTTSELLTVICLPTFLPYSRFGFLVSKKIDNKASRRNLVKRRLRYIIARQLPFIKGGYDCLLIAKNKIVDENYAAVESDVIKLLEKPLRLKSKSN